MIGKGIDMKLTIPQVSMDPSRAFHADLFIPATDDHESPVLDGTGNLEKIDLPVRKIIDPESMQVFLVQERQCGGLDHAVRGRFSLLCQPVRNDGRVFPACRGNGQQRVDFLLVAGPVANTRR